MIPLHLTIEGLYSYQTPQEIDFQLLTGNQLFGIFGPTGSGKSSILEAITLALYGQTERLNQRDRRSYNLMNLRTNKLQIEFEFSHGSKANGEDQRYLFTVRTRRNSRNFEDVYGLERQGYRHDGKDWEPLAEGSMAEEILGLNYDNFRRTIIIPQGKFEEFMDLREAERTRMLREIFRLEKFDLASKAGSLARQNENQLNEIEGELKGLEAASEEELVRLSKELSEVTKKRAENEKELVKVQKEWEIQDRGRDLHHRLKKAKARFGELHQQKDAFAQRKLKLDRYSRCLRDFKPMIDRKKELEHDFNAGEDHLQALAKKLKEAQKALHGAETALKLAKEQYDKRDQIRQEAEDLERKAQLIELNKEIIKLDTRIGTGTTKVEEKEQELSAAKKAINELETQLVELEKSSPDPARLVTLTNWINDHQRFEEKLERLQAEEKSLKSETQGLINGAREAARKAGVDARQLTLELKDLGKVLEQRFQSLEKEEEILKENIERLQQGQGLVEQARNLVEGEPCPVCGATHHPHPADLEDHQAEISRQRKRQSELRIGLDNTRLALNVFERDREIYKERIRAIEDIRKSIAETQQDFEKHQSSLDTTNGDQQNPQAISELLAQAEEIKQQKQNLRDRIEEKKTLQQSLENEFKSYSEHLRTLQNERQGKQASQETLRDTLKVLDFHGHEDDAPEVLRAQSRSRFEDLTKIEESLKNFEHSATKARGEVSLIQGKIEEAEKSLADDRQALAKQTGKLMTQVEQSEFSGLGEIQEVLDTNLDIDAEERSINSYQNELDTLRGLVDELQAQEGKERFDPEKWEKLQERLANLKAMSQTLGEQAGDLGRRHADAKQDLERKKQLLEQRQKLEARKTNLNVLKNLFRGSGFVNYVSSIYLRNLCEAANHRFSRLTRGALHLEVDSNNNFIVRDHLNGGRSRLAKTLSGGQRFQAALSLALALAEQVQQQVQARQNFFFLDEGFGSQDRESLQVIFQTLKALRREDRIVGVISHVEELQQEIDTCLFIRNDSEKGSLIRGSWE